PPSLRSSPESIFASLSLFLLSLKIKFSLRLVLLPLQPLLVSLTAMLLSSPLLSPARRRHQTLSHPARLQTFLLQPCRPLRLIFPGRLQLTTLLLLVTRFTAVRELAALPLNKLVPPLPT